MPSFQKSNKWSRGNWRASARPNACQSTHRSGLSHNDFQPASKRRLFSGIPVKGQILFLGTEVSVHPDSILRQTLGPEEGKPWSHPVMVFSVDEAAKTLTFLQLTSQDIVNRTRNPDWALRYVPITHRLDPSTWASVPTDNSPARKQTKYLDGFGNFWHHPTAGQPFLDLQDGGSTQRPSCVNVEQEFTIEWGYLQIVDQQRHLCLTDHSLQVIERFKRDFVPQWQVNALPWDNRESKDPFWQVENMAQAYLSPPASPRLEPSLSSGASSSSSTSNSADSTPHTSPPSSRPPTPEPPVTAPTISTSTAAYVPPHRRRGGR